MEESGYQYQESFFVYMLQLLNAHLKGSLTKPPLRLIHDSIRSPYDTEVIIPVYYITDMDDDELLNVTLDLGMEIQSRFYPADPYKFTGVSDQTIIKTLRE